MDNAKEYSRLSECYSELEFKSLSQLLTINF